MDKTVVTDKPLIEEIREKTFDQILREQATSRNEDATKPLEIEETDEEKKKKEDDAKAAQEAKDKADAETKAVDAKKHDEEVAVKAAQEVIDRQKAEEKEKADKIKAEEDEKKRQEDLKPKYSGKDKDGNSVPLSYEEMNAESVRIAKEEAKREVLAEIDAREKAKADEQTRATQTVEQQKAAQKTVEDQLQAELDSDLKDLYAANKLPKIGDPKDENDPGNKEFKNLFETAQRVNGERLTKGLPPIRSIKLIYYEHYKPLEKPAGNDAPVVGNESSQSHEPPEDKYVPSRDRNKSMTQLVKEEAARLGRKLNVRGS